MSDDLPMGWVETELGEIFEFNPRHSSSIDRSINVSFVPMPSVCEHNGIILPHSTKKLEEVWKGYTHFQNDDVIFAKITPCMENGKIALASNLHNDIACGSTEFHVLRSLGAVLPLYVWYFLRQRSFLRDAEQRMTGAVGQRRVPVNFLKETHLAIPPLNEQRRIVDKLERIGDRHRTARNELNHIPKLIARYKQAVLAAAFRGDLTADWRGKHEKMRTQWQNVTLDNLISCYQNGLSKRSGNDGQEIIVVRLADIKDFKVCLSDPRKIQLTEKEEEKYSLQAGDILVIRVNGSKDIVGRLVLITQDLKAAYCDHFIRLRLTSECNPYWLSYYGNSDEFRKYISENMVSSAGQNTVSQGTLKDYLVELPSLEEQKEIVRRIEKMFEKIDMMEQEYQKAAKLCDRLEQATLAKAFRGELVPQDPDDEPASVLLEQVKREKEKGKIKTKK